MAVGLSTRLLCALQPISVLVRDHLSAGISKRGRFARQNMPKFKIVSDPIRPKILHAAEMTELRTGAVRKLAAMPMYRLRQGYPS
jgi:hypothetical protein